MAAERTGWRAIPARRVAVFLGQAEEQPTPSRAARTADAAIAAAATVAGVVAVILQFRTAVGPVGTFIAKPGFPVVRLGPPPAASPSDGLLLGAALTTAPLAFRRIYPITAFCVIMAAVIGTSGHATTVTFVAVICAAYCAVAYSPFRRAALAAVLAAAITVTAAYPDTSPPVPKRFGALLVLLPTVAVGIAIRTWRRRAGESAERLRLAQAAHEAETRRAVETERARIASELHDVVTHNVSVMVVQAGAARRVLDGSPDDAREALLAIEASGRTAMTELRHLLGLLAPAEPTAPSGEPGAGGTVGTGGAVGEPGTGGQAGAAGAGDGALRPQPGLGNVPALVERVRAAGMPVELSVTGTPRDLPQGLDLAGYRVVQEALTNVIKHAQQARTTVRVEYHAGDLVIEVANEAPAGPGTGLGAGGGRGLIGLRERIAIYGGTFAAGPRPGGGWRVRAAIPLEPAGTDPGAPAPACSRRASA